MSGLLPTLFIASHSRSPKELPTHVKQLRSIYTTYFRYIHGTTCSNRTIWCESSKQSQLLYGTFTIITSITSTATTRNTYSALMNSLSGRHVCVAQTIKRLLRELHVRIHLQAIHKAPPPTTKAAASLQSGEGTRDIKKRR